MMMRVSSIVQCKWSRVSCKNDGERRYTKGLLTIRSIGTGLLEKYVATAFSYRQTTIFERCRVKHATYRM